MRGFLEQACRVNALGVSHIAPALAAKGIDVTVSAARGALPPEDLTRAARDMTVLVSCWK